MPLIRTSPHLQRDLVIHRASGFLLYDSTDRALVDFNASFGVASLGYGNGVLAKRLNEQYGQLSHAISCIYKYVNENVAIDKLMSLLGLSPDEYGGFFLNSGAEAAEVAMKAASLLNGKKEFLYFERAYHGVSVGTLPVNGHSVFRLPIPFLANSIGIEIPFPEQEDGVSTDEVLSNIEALLKSHTISAIIFEPMQNLGGYRELSNSFLSALRSMCLEHNTFLVADEIFTGAGRCGSWSLSLAKGIVPDFFLFGKGLTGGLPGSVIIAKRENLEVLYRHGTTPLHATTYLNSPLIASMCEASLELISELDLLTRALKFHDLTRKIHDESIACLFPSQRLLGLGAANGMLFPNTANSSGRQKAERIVKGALDAGVFVLQSGFPEANVVTLCPPLIMDLNTYTSSLQKVLEVVEIVLKQG